MYECGPATERQGDFLDDLLAMKSAYDSQIYQEELRCVLSDIVTNQFELSSSTHLLTLVHSELKTNQEAFQLRLTQSAGQKPLTFQQMKERCLKIKEQNKAMLLRTLNLRQALINLMPRGKAYQPELEDQLGRILDKIRLKKERALQKINHLKYLRGHRNRARKAAGNQPSIPIPLEELKNASQHLGRQALIFSTELKVLLKEISMEKGYSQ